MSLAVTFSSVIKSYANGLFLSISENLNSGKFNNLSFKEACAQIKTLKEILASKDFQKLLSMPSLSNDIFEKIMKEICEKEGINKLLLNFCLVVKQNSRIFLLDFMFDAFLNMVSFSKDEITAELVVAQNLMPELQKKIQTTLEEILGKKVNLEVKINENLLGGFIVKTDSRIFDASVSSQLDKMKEKLIRS